MAMHEPYKSDNISCKNTFGVKKMQPSKAELYVEWMHEQIGDKNRSDKNTAKA